MPQSQLQGVMIGAGFFGGHQAEAWTRIPQARITAVADPIPEKAREFADQWQIPNAYMDVEEMLEREQPDFVDIATRPDSHRQLVQIAAQHGIHVICQKPMAPTWQECLDMVECCREANVRLLIHENWRWQPWYREVKRLVQEGELGELFHIGVTMRTGDGRGDQPYTVQPYFREMKQLLVYETLVHFLDTFRLLAGEFESIFCQLGRINPIIAGEDYALVQLRFQNGVHGLIDSNRINGPIPASLTLGTLRVEGNRGALRLSDDGRLWLTRHGKNENEHRYSWPDRGYRGDSVHATQVHLIDCLRNDVPSESDGDDYLKTVAAVDACYRSADSHAPASLGHDPPGE